MAGEVTLCVFCACNSMRSLLDRKGRPYLSCYRCGTRVFVKDFIGVAGYGRCVESLDYPRYLREFQFQADLIARGGLTVAPMPPVEAVAPVLPVTAPAGGAA